MHFLHDHAPISLYTDASDFGVGVIVFRCLSDMMYSNSLHVHAYVCVHVHSYAHL